MVNGGGVVNEGGVVSGDGVVNEGGVGSWDGVVNDGSQSTTHPLIMLHHPPTNHVAPPTH